MKAMVTGYLTGNTMALTYKEWLQFKVTNMVPHQAQALHILVLHTWAPHS